MGTWARARLGFLTVLAVLWCARAAAQAPLALDQLVDEVNLADRVGLLRDPSGALTLGDVQPVEFAAHDGSPLSFGLDDAALWLRFRARNDSAEAKHWLLEIGEPGLEEVELMVVHRDGRLERYRSGTSMPFASRPIGHANVVFELTAPAHDDADCFVRTRGLFMRVPLRAWTPHSYAAQHELDTIMHTLCLGAMLLVALYHLGILSLVRQVENAWYAFVSLSLALVHMSLNGQLAQLLLPNQPELVMRAPVLTIALGMVTVACFTHAATDQLKTQPALTRILALVCVGTLGVLAFAVFAPRGVALLVELIILLSVTTAGPYLLYVVSGYAIPELRRYMVGWYALIISIPISIFRYTGIFADSWWSDWMLPVGFVAYGLSNSLALAALAARLRAEVSMINAQLVENVAQLERATKARDEFMATMSHELRTPLNAIINIPQGLVGEFITLRSAKCSHCHASFLLDEGDVVGPETVCLDCAQAGTLVEGTKVKFNGDDARCLRFLQKIERSGQHLLQMVNGVLDYSKLEAGRVELALAPLDLEALVREVLDQVAEIAQRKNVQLTLDPTSRLAEPITADSLRLRQVLINLLANAIKFSEADGTVTIRFAGSADAVRIEVQDYGIGIAAENHDRVFMSFEQVHKGDTRKYGGTGLGLSISRSLVRMHGGELSVRSELGKGATFEVYLPRLPALAGAAENTPAPDNTNGLAQPGNALIAVKV